MRSRSVATSKWIAGGLFLLLVGGQGCDLNPQPLPPGLPGFNVSGDDSGSGSSSSGGGGQNDGSSVFAAGPGDASAAGDATAAPLFAEAGSDAPTSGDARAADVSVDGGEADGSSDVGDAGNGLPND